jgi:uncharacterized membrane protein YfcA
VAAVTLILSIVAVVFAGLLQRLTGIGYSLVASPALIIALGVDEAVRLVILTSLVASSYSLTVTWADRHTAQVVPLLPFAVLAIWPSALVAQAVNPNLSTLGAGVVVLLALVIPQRASRVLGGSRWRQAAIAGTLSGAMNAVAALGGPMAAAYGIRQRWSDSLVPNLQLFLFVTSLAVLVARGWPAVTAGWQLVLLMVAAALGVQLGGRLAAHVSARDAGRLTGLIALVGALAAIGRGVAGLV